ncbi:MAG: bifunctional metallophosphatase/5'-nucleotidase [Oscillospiraceae bacterium]|nr:bifunctional metallophosphatase/5'-nucleotidase [Oscillospiraceae bacterium]
MKKWFICGLAVLMALLLCLPAGVRAAEAKSGDIVVLYTNDVHCAVDAASPEGTMGYANLAALKKELEATHTYVALVDAGDAIQGDAIGTLSNGEYLVDIMNHLGYDYAVFGNHEFDYGMDTAKSLLTKAKAQYLACNFVDLRTGEAVAQPYSIVSYGERKVAYVGIATPESFTKSTPTYFQDSQGNYIYSFCEGGGGQALYDAVQSAIDAAAAEGADTIIALGHLGTDPASAPWHSYDVIANTKGLDAFIDGHSHSTIAGEEVTDKAGKPVLLTSTGTKLENIGKLTIAADGSITTELISAYPHTDPETDAYIKSIQSQFADKLNEVVGHTHVELVIADPETGERIIRNHETNLGDFCADAYRVVTGADIGVTNGGGIRAALKPGEITYGDILAVHPYGNTMCVVEAEGWELLELLEVAAMEAPNEHGSFMHVSGLKYTIDTTVESSVVLDEYGMLVSIGDSRRVRDVSVLQKDGSYAPIDPMATYTLASHNYLIKEGGCSVTHFMDNKLLQDETMLDNQLLMVYLRDNLKGVVGDAYSNPYGDGRITILTDTQQEEIPVTGDGMVFVLSLPVLAAAVLLLMLKRKPR